MKRREYNSLDICKLLMAICVVAIHTHPLEHCSSSIINNIYTSFVIMAVPFFFLSSGFLLAQKFEFSFSSSQNIAVVKKHLLKIIKMYVSLNIVYLPMALYYFISAETGILKSVLLYLKGFVFIGQQYNSWHLWYLLSTIYALVFILILLRCKTTLPNAVIYISIIFLISVGIDYLSGYAGNSSIFMAFLIKMIKSTITSGRILTGLFYLPLGCILAQKQPSLTTSWSMLIAGFLSNVFIPYGYWSSVFAAVSSIGFFCVVNTVSLPASKIYLFARKMSTIVYFLHMYVWSFYYVLIYGETTYGMDCFLATIVICLAVSAVTVLVTECNHKRKIKEIQC